MFSGYFAGILLVVELIVIGIQVWYILSLRADGEIGNQRFTVLLLISLLSLFVAITPFIGVRVVPGFLVLVFLSLPIVSLKVSQCLEKKHGEVMDAARIHEEIGKWEYTIQKDPEFAGAYTFLGDLHLKLGEKDKALAYYKKALSLKPDDPKILDQIMFVERKMETIPKLTKSDLDIVKGELKRFPLIFGLVLAVILSIVFAVYLLHVLPAPVVFLIVAIVPVILFFRWILKL
ncbi:MAG: tetratricopeptide repeat protein [Candidatus Ratteibacteria bacterium]|jgi:tetratricopeptide (TPR) repeat protein